MVKSASVSGDIVLGRLDGIAAVIHEKAHDHDLAPRLVASFVAHESRADCYAANPEPHYRYLWDVRAWRPFRRLTVAERASEKPPADFSAARGTDPDTEWWFQQVGLGLMQVQGAVARERGFRGPYLLELTDPEVNLEYGCRHLRWIADRLSRQDSYTDAALLASYNGGLQYGPPFRNQGYVDHVLEWHRRLREWS